MLNLNQSPQELNEVHGIKDYYDYLRSPEFQTTVLKPLAFIINKRGGPCLDVGCGQGYLSSFVEVPYLGFDGSQTAVDHARKNNPGEFRFARFEDIESVVDSVSDFASHYNIIVIGNLLSVLIKPESYVSFLQSYIKAFSAKYFVICDLQTLDTSDIERNFSCLYRHYTNVQLAGLQEIKRKRKILLYKTS